MKELTIEEKAKAYDAAIKRAETVIKVAQNQKEVYGCVTTILPELKDSEDERIRKEIVDFITSSNKYGTNERCEAWLNWLEKQGTPEDKESEDELTWLKTFIEEEAYYLSMDIRDEADRKRLTKLQNVLAWLEKQGKKPTTIDIDKMVLEYSQTKNSDFGLPINCMIEAYRKGINDVLHSHILDPNKVIEWLRKNTCAACWDNPDEGVSQRIEQFKKDFEI